MKPTKLQQAVVYITGKLHSVPRTKLVKLVYLADEMFYNEFGRQLTEAVYRRQPRGPLPLHFNTVIDEMRGNELQVTERPVGNGVSYIHKLGINPRFAVQLNTDEQRVLDNVLHYFSRLSLDTILDVVYKTVPMTTILEKEQREGSQLGHAINFSEFIPTGLLRQFEAVQVDRSTRGSKEELTRRDMDSYHNTLAMRQKATRQAYKQPA